ncbi:MAG: hypothetical protein ACK559_11025, partial [bacterium]
RQLHIGLGGHRRAGRGLREGPRQRGIGGEGGPLGEVRGAGQDLRHAAHGPAEVGAQGLPVFGIAHPARALGEEGDGPLRRRPPAEGGLDPRGARHPRPPRLVVAAQRVGVVCEGGRREVHGVEAHHLQAGHHVRGHAPERGELLGAE